jgi:hypothetical protein
LNEQKSTLEWRREGGGGRVPLVGKSGAFAMHGQTYCWRTKDEELTVERLGAAAARACFDAALAVLKAVPAEYAELVDLEPLEIAATVSGTLHWKFSPNSHRAIEGDIAVWRVEA